MFKIGDKVRIVGKYDEDLFGTVASESFDFHFKGEVYKSYAVRLNKPLWFDKADYGTQSMVVGEESMIKRKAT